MSDHQAIQQRFDAWHQHRLPADEAVAVAAHVAACPDCTLAWQDYRRLASLVESLPVLDPGPAFAASVLAALPAPRRAAVDQGRIVLLLTGVTLTLLALGASPTLQTNPRLSQSLQTVQLWLSWRHVIVASLWQWGEALPWHVITQTLYATAAGLLIAWGAPVLPLAWARRRIPHR
jgi:hypothetical protein